MAEFIQRPLRLLDNIYRFVGGGAEPRTVNTGSGITLVHDVSRQAERAGRPYCGQVICSMNCAPAGAVVATTRMTRIDDFQVPLGFTDESYELWIMGVSVSVSNADKADVDAITGYMGSHASGDRKCVEVIQSGFAAMNLTAPLFSWAGTDLYLNELATGSNDYWGRLWVPPYPVRVPPSGFIAFTGDGGAAFSATCVWQLWAGEFGSSPPVAG